MNIIQERKQTIQKQLGVLAHQEIELRDRLEVVQKQRAQYLSALAVVEDLEIKSNEEEVKKTPPPPPPVKSE